MSKQLGSDQLTIRSLVSLEHPTLSENKSDETMQKSMKDFCAILSLYHVYLWTSLCWKDIYNAKLVVTTKLQYMPAVFVKR